MTHHRVPTPTPTVVWSAAWPTRAELAALGDADKLPALEAEIMRLRVELDAEQRKVSELLDDLRDDRR